MAFEAIRKCICWLASIYDILAIADPNGRPWKTRGF